MQSRENATHFGSKKVRVELPLESALFEPCFDYLGNLAKKLGMKEEKWLAVRKAAEQASHLILERNGDNKEKETEQDLEQKQEEETEEIFFELLQTEEKISLKIENPGAPIFFHSEKQTLLQNTPGKNLSSFSILSKELDEVSFENKGRKGQSVIFTNRLGQPTPSLVEEKKIPTPQKISSRKEIEKMEIRRLNAQEASQLSRLFYSVYQYNYIHDFVYYPDKMETLIANESLIPIAAVLPSGRILAHVALGKRNTEPLVYEPCLGVVDPHFKSQGLFGKVFDASMELANQIPMQYCFFDLVTNHHHSQKFVSKYHAVDLAIFVGCQNNQTQAKLEKLGMGSDPKESTRYSLLFSVLPRVQHPFGKEISLPAHFGESLEFLLKPLEMSWVPSSRFDFLAEHGQYELHVQRSQESAIYDFHQPGRSALEHILHSWKDLMRNGFQYAAVEVALPCQGLSNIYDHLAAKGFFLSGFIPYKNSNQLGMRFQTIGPTKVAFHEIKLYSPIAKELLKTIQKYYERNTFL